MDRTLKVNGKTFIVQYPDEPLYCMKDGKLETIVFKACGYTCYQWEPEEIEGYFDTCTVDNGDMSSLIK
ncbi:MAG: hypothetical protein V1874_10315 [Spirochaetota bacterium]